jgi:hypothetical protein
LGFHGDTVIVAWPPPLHVETVAYVNVTPSQLPEGVGVGVGVGVGEGEGEGEGVGVGVGVGIGVGEGEGEGLGTGLGATPPYVAFGGPRRYCLPNSPLYARR